MKLQIIILLTFVVSLAGSYSSETDDWIKQATNIEERRERESIEIQRSINEGKGEDARKHKMLVELLDKQQGEILLKISRKLLSIGYFKDKDSAIGNLVWTEKQVADTEALIKQIESQKLDKGDLPLALIALQKSRDTWEARAIQEGIFILCLELVNRRYPDMLNEQSAFAKQVQAKIDKAVAQKDPIGANPRHVLIFARQTEAEIYEKENEENLKFAPNPTPILPRK